MDKNCIHVCGRVNNTKRGYLVLNKAQCKHYPASPSKALEMFDELAEKVINRYSSEHILIVGFAETATAIGFRVAEKMRCDFIHTTREAGDTSKFIEFSEIHSHATEQKLFQLDFDKYDRVVFVEDEVTTGNTIMNIIKILKNRYPKLLFGVASLINGMTDEHFLKFLELYIPIDYLLQIDNTDYSEMAEKIDDSGMVITYDKNVKGDLFFDTVSMDIVDDARYGISPVNRGSDLVDIASNILNNCVINGFNDVLVLGTEEFMYPAIYIGSVLESSLDNVSCHSTTRSPIVVSKDKDYPLNTSIRIPSVYDINRDTYIYNLRKYDKVFLITETGAYYFDPLIKALSSFGNDVSVVKVGGYYA